MTLEDLAKHCQACAQKEPLIVLGSGSSIPHGIGAMGDLAKYLSETIQPESSEEDAWLLVKTALSQGDHLEAALEENQLPNSLVDKIVRSTWSFIARDDYNVFKEAIKRKDLFPLQVMFSGLFRSTTRNIHVVTTNYDRIAEYAADVGGYIHNTGFLPGYLRQAEGAENLIFKQGVNRARTITLWKVHGSLDWFADENGNAVSLPLTTELPEGLKPLIVTPGVSKYQRTHDEPFRSAIQGADSAINAASSFICVGYGFRDAHVHPKLTKKCGILHTPILILARTLTDEAKGFLNRHAGRNYLALEDHPNGTLVYNRENPSGTVVEGKKYWELAALNELIGF
jgi:hypothetical protein